MADSRNSALARPTDLSVCDLLLQKADIPLFTYDTVSIIDLNAMSFHSVDVQDTFFRRLFGLQSLSRVCVDRGTKLCFCNFSRNLLKATALQLKTVLLRNIPMEARALNMLAVAIRNGPQLTRLSGDNLNFASILYNVGGLEHIYLSSLNKVHDAEIFILCTTLRQANCRLRKVCLWSAKQSLLQQKQFGAALENNCKIVMVNGQHRSQFLKCWPPWTKP